MGDLEKLKAAIASGMRVVMPDVDLTGADLWGADLPD